jgi:hypothetical protein
MSNQDGYTVAKSYSLIDHFVRTDLKSILKAPFMTYHLWHTGDPIFEDDGQRIV